MSLQAALSKLRGNPSAVPSDDRGTPGSALTVDNSSAPAFPSWSPSRRQGAAVVRGAFDIPFDDAEEDDDDVSSFGVQGGGAGPALDSGLGEDQSGCDQVRGGRLGAVEKMLACSFTELQQKQAKSSDGAPSSKTLITGEGVSTGQWEVPACAADKEEELALNDDWLDAAWATGPRDGEQGMEDERSPQPHCQLDASHTANCRGWSLLGDRRQELPPVKRRFPGPAGALPQLVSWTVPQLGRGVRRAAVSLVRQPVRLLLQPPGQSLTQLLAWQPRRAPKTPCLSSRQGLCEYHRDNEVADFSTGPWKNMESDLQLDSPAAAPLRKCTLSKVLKQAARKRLPSGKVTHLRVRVKTLHRAGRNARVVMHDPTGEVCGTVHCEVLEEMGPSLGPGAVMLLRQVSVVSPRPRRHHLNITAANLVALYPAQGGRRSTGSGSFDLSTLIAETLGENNRRGLPCNGPSNGECPLFSGPSRPVVSADVPAPSGRCESHDQQPIDQLPPDMSSSDGLDDLEGISIADFDEWDSPEEEGPPVGQQRDSGDWTYANASKTTGSFFSDLLREDDLANFDEF